MKNLTLHIPHASTEIPLKEGYLVDQSKIDEEILKLTDWYTDDLFAFKEAITVKAEFSRIFCDTERFSDDSKEVMAKVGMGVIYEKCDDGTPLRKVSTSLRNRILQKYYWAHHDLLKKAVEQQLKAHNKAFIIDCHSFPDVPLKRSLNKENCRPDFNIGTDSYHTPEELLLLSKRFFEERGYTVGIDWPFSGSMVPLKYYKKDKRVVSIMLEVNRKNYLEDNGNIKSANYLKTKKVIQDFLRSLNENINFKNTQR